MKKLDLELVVGLFLLVAIVALTYISIRLGEVSLGEWGYTVYADFPTAGGLQSGAVVELAGVEIGRVESVDLADYQARVTLKIRRDIELQDDTVVSIKSKGLIGEKYVDITPGKAETMILPGGRIRKAESPVDIQDLLAQYIFGSVDRQAPEENAESWTLDLE
jgi:phospholipid/cholesterol/gamma-HCH transport system substrate-binding protein